MSKNASGGKRVDLLSDPQRALYNDFWVRLRTDKETEMHPALKLAESWQHALDLVSYLNKSSMEVFFTLSEKARTAFDDEGSSAWIHLFVAHQRLHAPSPSISLASDLFKLLLDAATIHGHTGITIRSVEEAQSRLQAVEDIVDIDIDWRSPAKTALLLHALDRTAFCYRSRPESGFRSWFAPLLASLLRIVFIFHRHFWAELNRWTAIQETPLAELSEELARIDALKANGRKLQNMLRNSVREVLSGNLDPSNLAKSLDFILHTTSEQAKSSNLSQHSLLAVSSGGNQNSDRMPYRERLQEIAPVAHWLLEQEGGWYSHDPRKQLMFNQLLDQAFKHGWPKDYLSHLFPSSLSQPVQPAQNTTNRQGSLSGTAWALDGELTLFMILAWHAERMSASDNNDNLVLTDRDLLPSFARTAASDGHIYSLPPDLYTLLAARLGLFDQYESPTARFWSFYNFLEHEALRSNTTTNNCVSSCSFKAFIKEFYGEVLVLGEPPSTPAIVRIFERLTKPSCCQTTDQLMKHSRLESLLLEILLRDGLRLPTSLFLMPLLRAEWTGQGYYPLAIYAGTLMGLENEYWPYVTARANAHLAAIYDAIQPVVELLVAQVLVEYVSHLRQTRDILDDATGHFLQDLDRVDILDSSLHADTAGKVGHLLLSTLNEFTVKRGKRLSDMGIRLTVAMAAALGEENEGGERSQRLLGRLRTIIHDSIAEGRLSSSRILGALGSFRENWDEKSFMDAKISGSDESVEMRDFFGSFRRRLTNPRLRDQAVGIIEGLVLRPAWELGRFIAMTPEVGHPEKAMTPDEPARLKRKVGHAWDGFPEILKNQGPGRVVGQMKDSVDAESWEKARYIWQQMRVDDNDRLKTKIMEWMKGADLSEGMLFPVHDTQSLPVYATETKNLRGRKLFPYNVVLPCPQLQGANGNIIDAIYVLLCNRCQSKCPGESYTLVMGWKDVEYFYLRLNYEHPDEESFTKLLDRISGKDFQKSSADWQSKKTVSLWRHLGQWISIRLTIDSRCYELGSGWREEHAGGEVSIEFRLMAYQRPTGDEHAGK